MTGVFEIKVTVDLPGVPEAIHALACAILHDSASAPMAVTTPATVTKEAPQTESAAPAPTPGTVTAPETIVVSAAASASTLDQAPAPTPAKEYSFKQISTAGARLCANQETMNKLVELLNGKYGVPAITMIDKSRYSELADDLIQLGAKIEEE